MSKRAIYALFAGFTIAMNVVLPAGALKKMGIDTPRVHEIMKTGEERGGAITIYNSDEKEPMRIKVYINDLVYVAAGGYDFVPAGSTPWSCAEWVKVAPTELEIPPSQEGRVRYQIKIPEGAVGGRYGVIFFQGSGQYQDLITSGTSVNFRIGSIVLAEVEGTQKYVAEITGLSISEKTDNPREYDVACTIYNGGNVLARPFGTVSIIDKDKNKVGEIQFNPDKTGVFPKTSRTFFLTYGCKDLAAGDYFAQVVLDYGGPSYLGGQKQFTVK